LGLVGAELQQSGLDQVKVVYFKIEVRLLRIMLAWPIGSAVPEGSGLDHTS